jgi:protease-4
MKKFLGALKYILLLPWRLLTWLRHILANLILLVVIIMLAMVFFSREKPIASSEKGALYVAPEGNIVEQRTYMAPFAILMNSNEQHDRETLLHDITFAIDHAATDKNITALVIDTGWMEEADPSKIFSIGSAIERFRKTGKPVFAVGDNYSQSQYLLASYANHIYLNPMGAVELHGFGAYPNYFRDALDKLKVNVHVFRVGEYKSFVEPFVRNNMSEEARSNTSLWLNELWQQYTAQVETARKMVPGTLDSYINHVDINMEAVEGNAAKMALNAKLVDMIGTRDEMKLWISKVVGRNAEGDSFAAVDMDDYLQKTQSSFPVIGNKVGVIVAKGEIQDGEQPAGEIGGDSLAEQIAQARKDNNVKALVLRIDSPGGSAFAAEIIRREIELTQKAGKPVIASFGGVAASGGYWIASTADEIWSTPSTITGSIGVFGMIPTFEHSIEALGIYSDGVGTTELAGAMHLDRAMSPLLEKSIQLEVEHTYRDFIELAARGRKSTPEKINLIAQGQVWSGVKAKELGLVDHLGDLNDAIASAAEKAHLGKDYRWDFIEKPLSPKEELLRKLATETSRVAGFHATHQVMNPVDRLIALVRQQLKMLAEFNDPRGVYVRCMECVIK